MKVFIPQLQKEVHFTLNDLTTAEKQQCTAFARMRAQLFTLKEDTNSGKACLCMMFPDKSFAFAYVYCAKMVYVKRILLNE